MARRPSAALLGLHLKSETQLPKPARRPCAALAGLHLQKNRDKYKDLLKEDMAPLTRIFRAYPLAEPSHPSFPQYAKQIQALCSKLPRRLRAGRLEMLSRTLHGQNSPKPTHACKPGHLCYMHSRLNRRMVYSIWNFVHENLEWGIPTYLRRFLEKNLLTPEQESQMLAFVPVMEMWDRHDHGAEGYAVPGRSPVRPMMCVRRANGARKTVPVWHYQSNECAACMLARIGSDGDVLFALYAGTVARMRLNHRRRAASNRIQFMRTWLRHFDDSDTGALEKNALALGKELARIYKEKRRKSRPEPLKFVDGDPNWKPSGPLSGLSAPLSAPLSPPETPFKPWTAATRIDSPLSEGACESPRPFDAPAGYVPLPNRGYGTWTMQELQEEPPQQPPRWNDSVRDKPIERVPSYKSMVTVTTEALERPAGRDEPILRAGSMAPKTSSKKRLHREASVKSDVTVTTVASGRPAIWDEPLFRPRPVAPKVASKKKPAPLLGIKKSDISAPIVSAPPKKEPDDYVFKLPTRERSTARSEYSQAKRVPAEEDQSTSQRDIKGDAASIAASSVYSQPAAPFNDDWHHRRFDPVQPYAPSEPYAASTVGTVISSVSDCVTEDIDIDELLGPELPLLFPDGIPQYPDFPPVHDDDKEDPEEEDTIQKAMETESVINRRASRFFGGPFSDNGWG